MKALIVFVIGSVLAVPVYAQRGGATGGNGGSHGGGTGGNGGSRGGKGGFGNGFGSGFGNSFGGCLGGFNGIGVNGLGFNRGGFNRVGFNNGLGFINGFGFVNGFGFNNGFAFNNGLGFNNGFGCGGGVGVGYWGYDSGYGYPLDGGYANAAPAVPPQQSSPGVNIVYGTPAPVYTERAKPVIHEYDYGEHTQQPGGAAASPIYLIAFQNDHAIRVAASYWVDGQTLHYVTQQHEEKLAPLGSIDRALTLQLNRERGVAFPLP
jgi:hypothetical protein